MKKLFVLILILTLVTLGANASTRTKRDRASQKEQRQIKNQPKIQRALAILQSYKFKLIIPVTFHNRYTASGYTDGWVADLDVSSPYYEVKSTDTDSVKSIYTLVYYCSVKTGVERTLKVEYNFKTGYLKVTEYTHKGSRVIVASNYSCIYALDEEPVK